MIDVGIVKSTHLDPQQDEQEAIVAAAESAKAKAKIEAEEVK